MGNKKIFLVEDQTIIALDIFNILHKEGFSDISLVRNISQLSEKILFELPDLIIFDLSQNSEKPIITFINTVCTKQKLPFFIITSQSIDRIEKLIEVSKNIFVSKPFREEDVISAVNTILN